MQLDKIRAHSMHTSQDCWAALASPRYHMWFRDKLLGKEEGEGASDLPSCVFNLILCYIISNKDRNADRKTAEGQQMLH